MVDAFKPDFVAPMVGFLSSDGMCFSAFDLLIGIDNANNTHLAVETSGSLFEVSGGWAAQTRWQRAGGYGFPVNKPLTPEAILSKWNLFTNFGNHCRLRYRYRVFCVLTP